MAVDAPGSVKMLAVEGPGNEVVVGVVVDADEAVGAVALLPDPCLEGRFDGRQFLLGRLGVDRVELAPLGSVGLADNVVVLRDMGVERVFEQVGGIGGDGCPRSRSN